MSTKAIGEYLITFYKMVVFFQKRLKGFIIENKIRIKILHNQLL
jgi:hypothetical protein